MRILHEPVATVERIINELGSIEEYYPDCTFSYRDCVANDNYFTAAHLISRQDWNAWGHGNRMAAF